MNDARERSPIGAGEPVLRCSSLSRHFWQGHSCLEVLNDIEFSVDRGERVAIVGASGSGKTTLLQLLGGLDRPTAGAVYILGQDLTHMADAARGRMRNRAVGFVYQFHHLLPEFTALENVAMPLLVRREPPAVASARATELLERVGLGERLAHKPSELSGGERQRAAVARALITEPALVLADEPTGNLDERTGSKVLDLMLELNVELGTSLVVVTHDHEIAARMQRVLTLTDGHLHETRSSGTARP